MGCAPNQGRVPVGVSIAPSIIATVPVLRIFAALHSLSLYPSRNSHRFLARPRPLLAGGVSAADTFMALRRVAATGLCILLPTSVDAELMRHLERAGSARAHHPAGASPRAEPIWQVE